MLRFTTQRHYIDKSDWLMGPWQKEPDSIAWIDPDTGYECLIQRNSNFGSLCGYVTVPPSHPWYGKTEEDFGDQYLAAHGGVTFTGKLDEDLSEGWTFGFDCAHSGDMWQLRPMFNQEELAALSTAAHQLLAYSGSVRTTGVYRDVEYVYNEVVGLAHQLANR